jgi:hypothetical protein
MSAVPVPATAPPPARARRIRLPFSQWHLVLIPATIVLIFPWDGRAKGRRRG